VSDDPFAPAADVGIHRLSIPTPFAVGRVNAYLIDDDPLTLVDSGPNSGSSLDELERQVAAHGRRLQDVELIVITHQHIDHLGLVGIAAQRSGAEVAAIDAMVPFVENYSREAAEDDEFSSSLMLRHGFPSEVVQALRSVSAAFRAWGARASVSRVLHDGDRLEFGQRTLEVHFRPGHSPSDTVFHDPERRMLIAGDHLLGHISSNPLIARVPGQDTRQQSLVQYLRSLGQTREMEVALVLPGHGDPIENHRSLIDKRISLHARRAEKLLRLVSQRPLTGYELAQEMWGDIAVTQAYLTLSEVIGHMDVLVNDGRVRELDEAGVVRFEAVSRNGG
jgi:glyoxylase-like metal-dependent hydrolase (beta-lactamase superfamily II)